ncbi:MAG: energy-coupling factor transporter transmembrane component T family protein [Candidatus Thorarchaeota archaeon]
MAFEYVKKDTPLDRMSPLVKLLLMSLALLLVIQCTKIEYMSILLIWILFGSLWWLVGKVELSSLGFILKLLSMLFVFLFIVQGLMYRFGDTTVILKLFDFPLFDHNGNVVVNYGEITVGGIMYGLLVMLRVIAVVTVVPIFTMTSPMTKISGALQKIRVPQKIIFMFITAMRFVPLVQESMDAIIEAQKIRGFDIDAASMYQKFRRAYVPIITPLLLLMFRRAMDLEVAINARAFGASENRTNIEDLSFKTRDYLGIIIIVGVFSLMMYLMYFETTSITWRYLFIIVSTILTITSEFIVAAGLDVIIQNLNQFLLSLPVLNWIGGFLDQNLLLGYGAIIVALLIIYIIYKLIRRVTKKKKRVKR